MKHLLIIFSLLLTSVSWSENLGGTMSCKIKDINISQINEGIPKTYKGIEGGFSIGDTMFIEYDYDYYRNITLEIKNKSGNKPPVFFFASDTIVQKQGWQKKLPNTYFGEKSAISSDSFEFEGISANTIELVRYYKNDWNGLLTQSRSLSMHVYSLDCRHTNDNLDEILNDLKSKGY